MQQPVRRVGPKQWCHRPIRTLAHFYRPIFPNSPRRQLPRNFFPPHARANTFRELRMIVAHIGERREKRADSLVRVRDRERDQNTRDSNDDSDGDGNGDGDGDGKDTFANPDRRARRLRRALDHPRSARDSATHPPSPIRSLAHSTTHSLTRPVRCYTPTNHPC